MQNWAEHFEKIATTREDRVEDLKILKAKVDDIYMASFTTNWNQS